MTKKKRVKASELKHDRPVNPLIVEAITAYVKSGGEGYEMRTVPARKIRIPEGFEATPEGLAIMRRDFASRRRLFETQAVMVLERRDGSLWSYDDVHAITLYHELAPLAMIHGGYHRS